MSDPLVDIAVKALDYIGRATIQSLTQRGSAEAAVCNRNIGQAVEETLGAIDWNFARTFRTGAALTVDMPPGSVYQYAYAFPGDCLRVRRIGKTINTENVVEWEIGSVNATGEIVIYTTRAAAVIVYTRRNANLLLGPASFRVAAAWNLAASIVGTLRKAEPNWRTKCETNYRTALSAAATLDANESAPDNSDADIPEHIAARGYDGPR